MTVHAPLVSLLCAQGGRHARGRRRAPHRGVGRAWGLLRRSAMCQALVQAMGGCLDAIAARRRCLDGAMLTREGGS